MTAAKSKTILRALVFAIPLAGPPVHARAQTASAPARAAGSESTPEAQSPEKKREVEDENDVYRHSPAVQSFGRLLGMNPEQAATAFTLINFAALAGLAGWFLARLLPKTFRNRNGAIQKHLVEARTATEDAGARLHSVEERLGKLDGEIAGIRAQAERDSAADERRILNTIEEDKAKIMAAAEQEISAATMQAKRQIQKYAAELAIEQATRKLSISAETDRLLVQNFARRLGGDESKEGQN